MRNRILALFIVLFSAIPVLRAADISAKDSKELLNLVATEKDFSDAADLLVSADNVAELKKDADIDEKMKALAEEYNGDLADWDAVSSEEVKREVKPKTKAEPKEDPEDISNKSSWVIFWLSFGSGLLALMTPCVFPMIPMTVSFFTKQSKTKAQGIRNAIIFGVSIIVIYILLGSVITAIFGAEVLNEMSTNPTFNIVFFILLVVFAVSFMGAFEIRLPSSWLNKADSKADKGGMIGIFFMALALALVSFSCTGPIVGTLLVQAAEVGGMTPIIGMFGFSLALALPFALFAAFPGWMNSMPSSGGWLNTVKVVLGFLELALAFKFLSNADLSLQAHMLERELFLAIWIGIFLVLAMYLLGFLTLPHDTKVERLSVGRTLMGTFTLVFVLYMIPGLWGAPLKMISAFPPPLQYAESPMGVGGSGGSGGSSAKSEHPDGTHLGPQNIWVFHDYDKALAYAKEVNKPLFVDFTGHNCVNCRKMEMSVWGEPGIIDVLRDDVVVVSLHVDAREKLPKSEWKTVTYSNGRKKDLRTTGDKWMAMQIMDYGATAQPYYVMQNPDGEDVSSGPATYRDHSVPSDFNDWFKESLK
jgi:thiol:disulfide interchange protein DsbD